MNSKNGSSFDFFQVVAKLIVPVLIGVGSSGLTIMMSTARLEERMAHIELDHLQIKAEQISLRDRDTDYEKRVSKLEAYTERNQRSLDEIKGDVKILLRRSGG